MANSVMWLAPFWEEVGLERHDVQSKAARWIQENSISSFGDIVDMRLDVSFVEALNLGAAHRRKAAAFLLALRNTVSERDALASSDSAWGRQFTIPVSEARKAVLISRSGFGRQPQSRRMRSQCLDSDVDAFALPPCEEDAPTPTFASLEHSLQTSCNAVQAVSAEASCLHAVTNPDTRAVASQKAAYVAGQIVEVYSISRCAWVEAYVQGLLPDGVVDVVYRDFEFEKQILLSEQGQMLRPLAQSAAATDQSDDSPAVLAPKSPSARSVRDQLRSTATPFRSSARERRLRM